MHQAESSAHIGFYVGGCGRLEWLHLPRWRHGHAQQDENACRAEYVAVVLRATSALGNGPATQLTSIVFRMSVVEFRRRCMGGGDTEDRKFSGEFWNSARAASLSTAMCGRAPGARCR